MQPSLLRSAPKAPLTPQQQRGAELRSIIAKLKACVGDEHVLASNQDALRYSRCTIPWNTRCAAIVFPANCAEIREVLNVAREHKRPLWTFSRGHNWGYGTTLATEEETIIVILERMNQILEVNEELAYAVIEPGVSQQQLNAYLKARRIPLWTDCTDSTPDGSLIGNALDKGVGYTPYGDHFGALCGMEVLLASGELIRTGGGPANCKTWHTYKWGTGPFVDGLFGQSNLGIVTKAGIWLMPEPQAFQALVFEVPDARDFPGALDATRRLALQRTLSNVHWFNDYLLQTSLSQYPYELRNGKTHLSKETCAALSRQHHLASWTMVGGIYGSTEQVRAHCALIRQELGRYGKIQFLDDQRISWVKRLLSLIRRSQGTSFHPLLKAAKRFFMGSASVDALKALTEIYPILKGVPGEFIVSSAYYKRRGGRPISGVDPARDGCGLIWFAPVVPATGRHTSEVRKAAEALFERHGFEFPLSVIFLNPRSVITAMPIFYDRDDSEETARAFQLYQTLGKEMERLGYQQYRTSVAYMEKLFRTAPAFHELLSTLKRSLDPDNILAPGRYGLSAR